MISNLAACLWNTFVELTCLCLPKSYIKRFEVLQNCYPSIDQAVIDIKEHLHSSQSDSP